MASLRRPLLLVALVLTAVTALSASTAAAAPAPVRPALPQAVTSTHFVVHYTDDSTATEHITQGQAQDVAAIAETAYATTVTTLGFAAPLDDGDGRVDIYVTDLSTVLSGGGLASAVVASSGFLSLDVDPTIVIDDPHELVGGVFDLIADYTWNFNDSWFIQAAGEWAAMYGDGFPPVDAAQVGPWDMSLDCEQLGSPTADSANCEADFFKGAGQSRWPFVEFLTERFGTGFVKTVFTTGASNGSPDELATLTNAIAGKGDTLANVFNDWATAKMSGGYTAKSLQSLLPTIAGSPVPTGSLASLQEGQPLGAPLVLSAPIATRSVMVGHLATKYAALQPGDGTSSGECFAASLAVTVKIPSGSGAKPAFWWSGKNGDDTKQTAQTLSVSGTTASITVPWDTCNWATTYGYVSLPNPSMNDGQTFVISGTLTIDPNHPAAPAVPKPVLLPSPLVPAPGTDPIPTIDVLGPSVIHLAAGATQLRVGISSTSIGQLTADFGGLDLPTTALRPGNNTVRFTLSSALRSAAGGRGALLHLAPLSTNGDAGKTVNVRVVVEPAAASAKASATAKAKLKTKVLNAKALKAKKAKALKAKKAKAAAKHVKRASH